LRRIECLSSEREFTLELWPLFEVFYFVMIFDGMIVSNFGVLLHPEHDDFERNQAGLPEHADELMDKSEQEHIADIFESVRETSASVPPAPCVGECKEVQFRGPALRTES